MSNNFGTQIYLHTSYDLQVLRLWSFQKKKDIKIVVRKYFNNDSTPH